MKRRNSVPAGAALPTRKKSYDTGRAMAAKDPFKISKGFGRYKSANA